MEMSEDNVQWPAGYRRRWH